VAFEASHIAAGAEAGLNPNTSIRHPEPEGTIAMRSEGLLQLAYADHSRYGCDFNWRMDRVLKVNDPARSILQPKNNLECGVKILCNHTIVQHKPLLTRSGYWSTLRPDGRSCRVFAKQMTNPPVVCGPGFAETLPQTAMRCISRRIEGCVVARNLLIANRLVRFRAGPQKGTAVATPGMPRKSIISMDFYGIIPSHEDFAKRTLRSAGHDDAGPPSPSGRH